MFERFRNFRVRFRNGAPAQYFLTSRIRNLSGSISKWRSRPILPRKEGSALLSFDFEMALPPITSSKTEFEIFRVRFRNGAPAQDLLQNRLRTFRAPISKCPKCSGDDVGGASDGTSKTQSVKFDLPLSDSVRGKSTLDGMIVAFVQMSLVRRRFGGSTNGSKLS